MTDFKSRLSTEYWCDRPWPNQFIFRVIFATAMRKVASPLPINTVIATLRVSLSIQLSLCMSPIVITSSATM